MNAVLQITADAWLNIVGLAVALIAGYGAYRALLYARDENRARNPSRALAVTVFGITLPLGTDPILCFAYPGTDEDACIIGVDIEVANIGEVIEDDLILTLELSSLVLVGAEHIIRKNRPFVIGKEVERACEATSEAMSEISYRLPYLAPKTSVALVEPIFLQPTFGRRVKMQSATSDGVKLDLTVMYNATVPCKMSVHSKLCPPRRLAFQMACVRASEVESAAMDVASKRLSVIDGKFVPISMGVHIIDFPFTKHPMPNGKSMYVYQGRSDGQVTLREVVPDLGAIFGLKE